MAFLDFLFGKKEKTQQFQRFTPQQQQLLNQVISNSKQQFPQTVDFLSQFLSNNPQVLDQLQAPARTSFEQKTIPTIAERFSSLNSQKSSAFNQALGQAGKSLEENLNAQRLNYGFNAASQLQNLLSAGMVPQFENTFRPRSAGFLESSAISLLPSLPFWFL